MQHIQMVDLRGQYEKIKEEVDNAIRECIDSAAFINGPQVKTFRSALAAYLGANHVITCGNGTDALQLAMMALGLKPGDEVIIPSFTYVATAEVIGLLGLVPVMVDVDPGTFNLKPENVEAAISPRTRAVIPVHLFGQCADMEAMMWLAGKYKLYVIEDNAQALGATFTFSGGSIKKAGNIGHIGCTSFFPSKSLGCFGDGGAVSTNDDELAAKLQMMANHGQEKKYVHKYIGINSRLDTLQAAILNVKLKKLDEYCQTRQKAAAYYDQELSGIKGIRIPERASRSSHVFHQYTIRAADGRRDALKEFLRSKGIPSMIYYPLPLNEQEAYKENGKVHGTLEVSAELCRSVLSLPMHTEITEETQHYIAGAIRDFFND